MNIPEKDKYPCVHACPVVKRLLEENEKLQKELENIKFFGSYKNYINAKTKTEKEDNK